MRRALGAAIAVVVAASFARAEPAPFTTLTYERHLVWTTPDGEFGENASDVWSLSFTGGALEAKLVDGQAPTRATVALTQAEYDRVAAAIARAPLDLPPTLSRTRNGETFVLRGEVGGKSVRAKGALKKLEPDAPLRPLVDAVLAIRARIERERAMTDCRARLVVANGKTSLVLIDAKTAPFASAGDVYELMDSEQLAALLAPLAGKTIRAEARLQRTRLGEGVATLESLYGVAADDVIDYSRQGSKPKKVAVVKKGELVRIGLVDGAWLVGDRVTPDGKTLGPGNGGWFKKAGLTFELPTAGIVASVP